ncbi:diguanylate cyclase [Acidaminobacter sp. JC074]|uniref:sensor domain-containing diguanylate cyclase n=1 Tax=Acidaminobacter sp. JC074 TaxID=2530199 RepID=UPI001F0F4481|nr:diguanylate cyclase [Acidaminobacter sp. JC074]MCH4890833.1 diguanylate cyclase [Acidaminobacter sp. JC074]
MLDNKKMTVEGIKTQFENALNIASLGTWEWYVGEGRITFDAKCFELIGFKNQFDGTIDFILNNVVYKDTVESFKEALSKVMNKEDIPNGIYKVNTEYGAEKWMKFYSQPIYKDGKLYKLTGLMMDVTNDVLREKEIKEHLDFKDSLLKIISYPIFYKNREGRYKYFNKAFEDFLGLDYDQIMDKTVYDISPKPLADIYYHADEDLMTSKGEQVYETKVKYADQSVHDVIFSKSAHLDEGGEVKGLVGIMHDITEQRQVQRKLEKLYEAKDILLKLSREVHLYREEKQFLSEILKQFKHALSNIDSAILLHLKDNFLTFYDSVNTNEETPTPSIPLEMTMLSEMVKSFEEVGIFNHLDPEDFHENDPGRDFLMTNPAKSMMLIPVKDENDVVWFFMYFSNEYNAFHEDDKSMSEYVRQEMSFILQFFKLYLHTLNLSRYDGLTGLMNRAYFDSVFKIKINEAEKEGNTFNLILFDLDKLKSVNDTFGHDAGDLYIDTLSQMLREFFPGTSIGRIGGDEFACLVNGNNVEATLIEMNDKFSSTVLDLFKSSSLGFSYGMSKYPQDGLTYKQLFKIADLNLYKNKEKSRGIE